MGEELCVLDLGEGSDLGFWLVFVAASGVGAVLSVDIELSDFEVAVSSIWKHRIQIFPSAMVKPRTWSMKGLDFRAPLGTPKM